MEQKLSFDTVIKHASYEHHPLYIVGLFYSISTSVVIKETIIEHANFRITRTGCVINISNISLN